jgi:hypothetical protein
MPIMPALGRLKQRDGEFQARLGYAVRVFSKKQKTKNKQNKKVGE